jgi:hypothetical protein
MHIHKKINEARHVWAFGCSFTRYHWKTWADIIKDKYGKVSNCGRVGAGNQYIFHSIMDAYTTEQIHKDDIIMICWSGHYRKDNKFKKEWNTPGNILKQYYWTMDFVKNYCDPEFFLERDLYYALAINEIFKERVINFSMGDIQLVDQYSDHRINIHMEREKISAMLNKFYPSFYKVLWNNKIQHLRNREDPHPTEDEHRAYLKKVFNI